MRIDFGPRGVLQIDDARIIFRNFSGTPSQYNHEGDRNFSVVIPNQDIADKLIADGWNVKIKSPREDGDDPFMYLPVKVKFNERGPKIYLETGRVRNELSEEDCHRLDKISIASVNMDIRPYDWIVNGEEGRTAYLQSIWVIQEVDRFAQKYAEEEAPEELPFV